MLWTSTDPDTLNAGQCPQLFQFARNMSHSDRAVVRGGVPIPFVHKIAHPYGKPVAAVRVADLKNRTRNRFTFRHQQFQLSVRSLNHG